MAVMAVDIQYVMVNINTLYLAMQYLPNSNSHDPSIVSD